MSEQFDPEVVKWYTRARKFPQLIGKTTDGTKIPGGPYTYTQVGAGVASLVLALKTTSIWGSFGVVGNGLVALGVAYGVTLILGQLPIGSRNPLAIVAGALTAYTAPASGKFAGRKLLIPRPHVVRGHRAPVAASETAIKPVLQAPEPQPVLSLPPSAPPQSPGTSRPALTAVQQLLAAGSTHEEQRP